ncbi:hypothetical protein CVT24_006205 [Panaeolus cyanescens]|uniref:HORMA domain-containing protein n=1 Tax=Panaeolus cyanescens TaxID=181874 RepID=A0A409VZZ4_9AGAR|nr:hypothetical protein CVT24_006205 [Panaeolus cyanescens]
MAIFGLWVINKAGGLVYQRNFADGLASLTSNEYLVLAGTLHGIHAITSRLSPVGSSSGVQVIEAETFKLNILLTITGTKFVLLTSLAETAADIILQKVYDIYSDAAVRPTTKAISQTQSLAAVQTLLKAGLGAITFLRNLLPEDNFTQCHLTTYDESLALSSDPDFPSSQPSQSQGDGDRRNVNTFKITEFGIFDALEKQYLRRFIFAVYLDSKNPQSIVEAYTFSFKYHKAEGHDVAYPVMTLEGTKTGRRQQRSEDAVSKAIREGRAPTLLDVKTSVKRQAMLKTLIQAMNTMEVLPRRRFATFKIYYTDTTPPDYEPPYFQSGDVDKDRWYLMTHNLDEEPDRYSIGNVMTGHHSVSLNVATIASFLPSSTANNNAVYSGLTNNAPGKVSLTPVQEAKAAQDQIEKQLEDAQTRNVVWPAEDDLTDDDAEGEDDMEYTRGDDGLAPLVPLGVIDKNGNLVPHNDADMYEEEARFGGVSQAVPQDLNEIVSPMVSYNLVSFLLFTSRRETKVLRQSIQTLKKHNALLRRRPEASRLGQAVGDDDDMLNMETQVPREIRPAETFGTMISTPNTASMRANKTPIVDNGLQCVEDPMCFCEAGCGRWFHVWCMGYHSTNDPDLPTEFSCFDCRVRGDLTWDLIKLDVYPGMVTKFQELATRAIKVAEDLSRFNVIEFTKVFGGENGLVRQMIKRLKDEGAKHCYIVALTFREHDVPIELIIDDVESTSNRHGTTTRSAKGNKTLAKPPKTRKHVAKSAYFRFQRHLISQQQYKKYFQPNDQAIEQQHLGVRDLLRSKRTTLALEKLGNGTKRVGDDLVEEDMHVKRVKISVTRALDLAQ